MQEEQRFIHLQKQIEAEAWFIRTVEGASLAPDQNASPSAMLTGDLHLSHLQDELRRVRSDLWEANFIASALAVLFMAFLFWVAHHA